jgi:hypothetical protein
MKIPEGRDRAKTASDTGSLVERAVGATDPAHSALGRVADTAAAVRLGAQLLPKGWRLFKRYPVSSAVVIVALVWTIYSIRSHAHQVTGESQS